MAAAVCARLPCSMHSVFFSTFSIEKLAGDNGPAWGLLCDKSGGRGPRVLGGSSTGENSVQQRSETFTCKLLQPTAAGFDETGFLTALKLAVESDLKSSGARITQAESAQAGKFSLTYTRAGAHGHIRISGRRVGADYYSLTAELDEKYRQP